MALWTDSRAKIELVNQYFSTLSPMAARIIESKSKVVNSFTKEDWSKKSLDEQEAVINDHFIPNSVKARYKNYPSSESLPEHHKSVFPSFVVDTGQSVILGREIEQESYKDEHSSPFSWETKSQMDLKLPPGKEKLPKETHTLKSVRLSDVSINLNGRASPSKNGSLKLKPMGKTAEKTIVNTQPQSKMYDQEKENWKQNKLKPVTKQPTPRRYEATEAEPSGNVAADVASKYNLQSVEKRRLTKPVPKNVQPFNPRSSLTLEDESQEAENQYDTGAIQNLEEAMREDELRNRQSTSQGNKSPVKYQLPSVSTSSESSAEGKEIEEAPLIKPGTSLQRLEKDDDIRKSGFDFLDNW